MDNVRSVSGLPVTYMIARHTRQPLLSADGPQSSEQGAGGPRKRMFRLGLEEWVGVSQVEKRC